MSATCEAFRIVGRGLCGQPSIGVSVTACVHEHVGRRGICATCAAEVQRWAAEDELICTWCDEGDEPHECRVVSSIEWADGTPATVVQGVRR